MEWSFHYEGPASGLGRALELHESRISKAAMTQFKLASAMLRAESQMCDQRGKSVNVTAYGSEGQENQPTRNLVIEVKAV